MTIAWEDKNNKKHKMDDISDSYLKNILGFISRGGGYTSFLDIEKINQLFSEADNRGLKHPYNIKEAVHAYLEKKDNQLDYCSTDFYLDHPW